MKIQRNYAPGGSTTKSFHECDKFVRGIMGPIGSGKSTACVMEIIRRSRMQEKSPDGIRRTRWAVIRNSYPELKSTTIRTWLEWCPAEYGKMTYDSPIIHRVKVGELDMEVLFLALDREEDQRKLLSLELTGAWVNEAREIPKGLVDTLTGRVGRYPPKIQGGATWYGVLLDTNPPDDQSWWYRLAEEQTPDNWQFFRQPAGNGPNAENLANLPDRYYQNLIAGKDDDWIKVYVRGEYGYVVEGKAVYPMFRDSVHVAPVDPAPTLALTIGVDFGLTPAATIGQRLADGRWLIVDELVTDNTGVKRFGELLVSYVRANYPSHDVAAVWGDPAGNQRAQTDERTAIEIMKEVTGWRCRAAPSNDLTMRLEAVRGALNRLIDGRPGIIVSPKCAMLRKGFSGGYHYKAIRVALGQQFHEEPNKNAYGHPHDSLQYLLLGGGEADVVMNKVRRGRTAGRNTNVAKDVDYAIL